MTASLTRTILVLAVLVFTGSATAAGPTFDRSWFSVDGGGDTSTGGSYEVHGVIGQHDASASQALTGGPYALTGGFLAGPTAPLCAGDIADSSGANMPDGVVDVFDLLALLANWGMDGVGADIAAPFDVVDVFDLLDLLATWGSCD